MNNLVAQEYLAAEDQVRKVISGELPATARGHDQLALAKLRHEAATAAFARELVGDYMKATEKTNVTMVVATICIAFMAVVQAISPFVTHWLGWKP